MLYMVRTGLKNAIDWWYWWWCLMHQKGKNGQKASFLAIFRAKIEIAIKSITIMEKLSRSG